MKVYHLLKTCLTLCIAMLVLNSAGAGTSLRDPGIPDREKTTYSFRVGNESEKLVEEVVIKEEDGKGIYEISSKSKSEDVVVKIVKDTMLPFYVHTVTRTKERTIDKKIALVEEKSKAGPDEIRTMDFPSLRYVLRGFPFNEGKSLKVIFLERGKMPIEIKVNLLKTEELKINNRNIGCYKLGLVGSGMMGFMFPKIYFWYSIELPHYLVRYEGTAGQLGAPRQIIELIDYSGWK